MSPSPKLPQANVHGAGIAAHVERLAPLDRCESGGESLLVGCLLNVSAIG